MKLPFKLPAFKLPSFGRKKAGTGESAEDSDFGDAEEQGSPGPEMPDGADPAPDRGAGGEEGDAVPDGSDTPDASGAPDAATTPDADPSALTALEDTLVDDAAVDGAGEDEASASGEAGESKKRRFMMIGAGGGALLVLLGVGLFIFSGGSGVDHPGKDGSGVPKFEMAIAPKAKPGASGSLNAIAEGEKGPGAGIVTVASSVLAYANIAPPKETDGPLPDIKDPGLIEQTSQGPLPKIAEDGRLPWKVYAKSVNPKDDRSKAVVIVTGLGLSKAATEAAITLLPGGVTLAFDPYAPDLAAWADKARKAGHETLIMVPLEPATFPADDPGPQGQMTTNETVENLLRLEFVLSRMQGYVGVISAMGSKFNQEESHLKAFLENLKARGLMFVDGSADSKSLAPATAEKMKLPKAFVDIVIDVTPTKEAVDTQLANLESLVRVNAVAVAIGEAYPVSIKRIAAWAAGLADKNIVLVPVSAVADRQFLR